MRAELKSSALSAYEKNLIQILLDSDQAHIFSNWAPPGEATDEKKALLADLSTVESSYPGGITAYINNARTLLAASKDGVNPFSGYQPEQPDTVDLTSLDDTYSEYEDVAMKNMDKIAVALVAGGLGERLGYPGIKLNIPVETLTETTYIQHYSTVILAMELRTGKPGSVPMIIMTSRDSHEKTMTALTENNFFGLQESQVTILKQELVPAIADNDGHIAMHGPYSVTLKPHGHGDIHMLMHTSGTAERLITDGKQHLLFIQDTNGQVFNAAFAAIGASIKHNLDFNSVAVNRIPGEAVGALTKLNNGDKCITINVEYNQLDPLLRSTVSPEGDVPNEKGFSIFPGNINVLVANLNTYAKVLKDSGGIIAEFVNPKYKDDTRTSFKKPTRLETMMQDLPKLFKSGENVGVTIFDRCWCFSANKNNIIDAKAKHEQGGPPESAATAESDFYLAGRMKLQLAGNTVNEHSEELILGIPFTRGPKVILTPRFALSIGDVKQKIRNLEMSDESTLILDGEDINIDGLKMSGSSALVIRTEKDAKVSIKDKEISNTGFELILLTDDDSSETAPEYLKIRGFKFKNRGAEILEFNTPGNYEV